MMALLVNLNEGGLSEHEKASFLDPTSVYRQNIDIRSDRSDARKMFQMCVSMQIKSRD